MAAYDWGPGNIQRAVMRTGYADFWELYKRNMLPAETKNYVPGIIAAIIMAKNPQQYGLENIMPEAPVVSDKVTVDYAVDLRLVADVAGASLEEIVALNPSLLRMTTPGTMDFDLHLPVGTKDAYVERIKDIPEEKRTSWRFHVVRSGESLEGIATALHAKPSEIATVNGIGVGQGLDVGDELVIPVATATSTVHTQRYIVRAGDTLVTVADRFNVTTSQLRTWNHLTSSTLKAGVQLNVAAPVRLAPATRVSAKKTHSSAGSTTAKSTGTKGTGTQSSATKSGTKNTSGVAKSKTGGAKTTPASSLR
jgi:membrane-bound lytic murein transglycosylase D